VVKRCLFYIFILFSRKDRHLILSESIYIYVFSAMSEYLVMTIFHTSIITTLQPPKEKQIIPVYNGVGTRRATLTNIPIKSGTGTYKPSSTAGLVTPVL
jgi:hypothetical protein